MNTSKSALELVDALALANDSISKPTTTETSHKESNVKPLVDNSLERILNMVNDTESYNEVLLGDPILPHNEVPQHVLDRKKRQQDSSYVPIQIPSPVNIHNFLKEPNRVPLSKVIANIRNKPMEMQPDLLEMLLTTYTAPNVVIVNGQSQQFDKDLAEEIIIIKATFHELIVNLGKIHIIEYYNRIFNDNQFDTLLTKPDTNITPVEMSDEDKQVFIHDYQKRMHAEEVRKRLNAKPPKYVVGEIVGAQDKEGKWWMSQVLATFSYLGQHIYYVTFLGWGEQFNEFIISPFKIQWFNPKKHRYYRPAHTRIPDVEMDDVSESAEPTERKEDVFAGGNRQ